MSTKISKKAFIEALRNMIRKEIEEVSTSAATPGYMTPNAFSGKGSMDRRNSIASGSGYDKVDESNIEELDEAKWAVKTPFGKVIVDANSKGEAKITVGKQLKKGIKSVLDVTRVQTAFGKQIDKKTESVNEGKYHEWRNDESLSPKQKIGHSIREVRNSLNELDKTVKMAVRLKTELNVDSRNYWKNTHKALTKISERLVKMATKVGNLK